MRSDWDAAVVVLRRNGKVLGVTRGSDPRDINLPGGLRDPGDATPFDTARRELLEETGLLLHSATPIASWISNGKYVIAFKGNAFSGKLRSSPEGRAGWVAPRKLLGKNCAYRGYNAGLLLREAAR